MHSLLFRLLLLRAIIVGTEVLPPGALRYDVMEEQPVGTVVGSIYASVGDSVPSSAVSLQYSLSPAVNEYVNIDPRSGLVRTSVVLDRELLCSTDYDNDCSLEPINVIIQGQGHSYYQLYKLIIRITDVNDHEPTFPVVMTSLNVSEATQPGTRLFVTAAEDADSDFYGVTEYHLEPISARQWFRTDFLVQPDGSQQVSLVLLQRLDREVTPSHLITLVAIDGGSPPKSGTTSVTINVIDINDNKPRFQLDRYEASVEENAAIGTSVIRVQAVDIDEGPNGQVVYRFADDYETQLYVDLLAIDRNTGLVYVSGRIDQEVTSQMHVTIVATDLGVGQQLSSRVHLYVTVIDVNDNAPTIQFTASSSSGSGLPVASHVTENSSGGTQVGHVTVRDSDKGDNGRVKCRVDDVMFQLVRLHPSSFQLVTAERAVFDRELVPERRVTVTCADNGSPAMTSSHVIKVFIDDVNDNSPVMSKSRFTFALNETSPASTVVGTVSASDPDRGPNGTVVYRLEPWLEGGNDDVTAMFAIDRKSGVVTSAATFDFETRQVMTFTVVASDQGHPSRSSSALVEVMLTDHNDERPLFDSLSYTFETTENLPVGTIIGWVKAVDRDIDPVNRRVRYAIKPPGPRDPSLEFVALDPISGQLTVKEGLDYERLQSLRFQVVASDSTASGAEFSHCDVTVHVVNANDNAPEFVFPSATNRSILLSARDIQVGQIVARLVGVDIDERHDSRLTFDLVYGDLASRSFAVNPVTGLVTVVQYEPWRWPIDSNDDVSDDVYRVKLVVKVTDSGQPRRTTTDQLDIEIHTAKSTVANLSRPAVYHSDGGDRQPTVNLFDTQGMIVVAGGAALGATCVIVLCVVVLCLTRVYCRRTKSRRVYNCRRNEDDRTVTESVTANQIDYSSMGRSKTKKGVTFDLVRGDVEDGGQWRNEPRVSSPVQHSRNYCMIPDCVLHNFNEGSLQQSNVFHTLPLPTVNKDHVWTHINSLPRDKHFPFSGFTNDELDIDLGFSFPRHIATLDGRISSSVPVPNTGRWSTGSLTDSGRGHSEGDDVTSPLYVQMLVSEPVTPTTTTMLESHV